MSDREIYAPPHKIDDQHRECKTWGGAYRSSKWHYRQRKIFFELIMHFIADTDTDENYLELIFRSRCRHSCSSQFWGSRIADNNDVGNNFDFIADTDTEKYYFRIVSAMNSDKRYFAFFLRFRQFAPHPPPRKIPFDEEGLLWGWCVFRSPLFNKLKATPTPNKTVHMA